MAWDASVEVNVDSSGASTKLSDRHDAIISALEDRLNLIDLMLQSKIVGDKLSGQLLNRRTGKLSDSVRVIDAAWSGDVLEGGVQAGGGPVTYARALEDGSAPHIIEAKNVKALHFFVDGKEYFRRLVHHPGNRAYLYMKGTLQEYSENIVGEMKAAVREASEA